MGGFIIITITTEKKILDDLVDAKLTKIESYPEIDKTNYKLFFEQKNGKNISLNGTGPLETNITRKCLKCGEPLGIDYNGNCPNCGSGDVDTVIHLEPLSIEISEVAYESEKKIS